MAKSKLHENDKVKIRAFDSVILTKSKFSKDLPRFYFNLLIQSLHICFTSELLRALKRSPRIILGKSSDFLRGLFRGFISKVQFSKDSKDFPRFFWGFQGFSKDFPRKKLGPPRNPRTIQSRVIGPFGLLKWRPNKSIVMTTILVAILLVILSHTIK